MKDVTNIEPVLVPLLRKDLALQGASRSVALGDKTVDFSPHFRLLLAASDAGMRVPTHAAPFLTVANFAITESALRTQLLALTLQHERPELEEQRRYRTLSAFSVSAPRALAVCLRGQCAWALSLTVTRACAAQRAPHAAGGNARGAGRAERGAPHKPCKRAGQHPGKWRTHRLAGPHQGRRARHRRLPARLGGRAGGPGRAARRVRACGRTRGAGVLRGGRPARSLPRVQVLAARVPAPVPPRARGGGAVRGGAAAHCGRQFGVHSPPTTSCAARRRALSVWRWRFRRSTHRQASRMRRR